MQVQNIFCPICTVDITHLSEMRRNIHTGNCCDNLEKVVEYESKKVQYDETRRTYFCPVCKIQLSFLTKLRIAHLKSCGAKHNIPLERLTEMVKTQRKEETQLPLGTIQVPDKNQPHPEFEKLHKKKLDTDLQTALAMSLPTPANPRKTAPAEADIPSILASTKRLKDIITERLDLISAVHPPSLPRFEVESASSSASYPSKKGKNRILWDLSAEGIVEEDFELAKSFETDRIKNLDLKSCSEFSAEFRQQVENLLVELLATKEHDSKLLDLDSFATNEDHLNVQIACLTDQTVSLRRAAEKSFCDDFKNLICELHEKISKNNQILVDKISALTTSHRKNALISQEIIQDPTSSSSTQLDFLPSIPSHQDSNSDTSLPDIQHILSSSKRPESNPQSSGDFMPSVDSTRPIQIVKSNHSIQANFSTCPSKPPQPMASSSSSSKSHIISSSSSSIIECPKYELMKPSELARLAKTYGLKVNPKSVLIAKLKQIFHQFNSQQSTSLALPTEQPTQLAVHENQSSSDSSESDTDTNDLENIERDFPETLSSCQDRATRKDLPRKLIDFCLQREHLLQKIYTYEPLHLEEILSEIKTTGISCTKESLMNFFDHQGIMFALPSTRRTKPLKKPRCKKKSQEILVY